MAEPVLLTGATGFVGRAVLAELLARGIPVHAACRNPGPVQDGVVWHSADLLTAAGRGSVVGHAPRLIHCAWEVEHGRFWTSPINASWQAASLDLVRRFRATGGQAVLAVGTCAEYEAMAAGPWNENRPVAPSTPYGRSKAALHLELSDLCSDNLIWARLFHLFGPGEDRRRLVPFLIDRLRSGQPAEVRASALIRDYASTAHVAKCLVGLLQAEVTGAYNIGSGAPRPLGDLARDVAAAVGWGAGLRLGDSPGADEPAVMAPDLRKLKAATGIEDENVSSAIDHLVRICHAREARIQS